MLPLAARPNCHNDVSAKGMASLVSTLRKWPATCSAGMFFRLNCKHLDSTVMGSFCGSVVANKNLTCGGGSSRVLSKALKLLVDNMCTSSMRYTLKRPRVGAYCTLSNSSRVSSTLVREAASTSIKSTKRPSVISTQLEHTPQGVELTPSSQLRQRAKIRAMVVLPTPRVPANKYA